MFVGQQGIFSPALIFAFVSLLAGCSNTQGISRNEKLSTVAVKTAPKNSASPTGEVPPASERKEKVIYTCQLADEETPAIQISELESIDYLRSTGVAAHLAGPQPINLILNGQKPFGPTNRFQRVRLAKASRLSMTRVLIQPDMTGF